MSALPIHLLPMEVAKRLSNSAIFALAWMFEQHEAIDQPIGFVIVNVNYLVKLNRDQKDALRVYIGELRWDRVRALVVQNVSRMVQAQQEHLEQNVTYPGRYVSSFNDAVAHELASWLLGVTESPSVSTSSFPRTGGAPGTLDSAAPFQWVYDSLRKQAFEAVTHKNSDSLTSSEALYEAWLKWLGLYDGSFAEHQYNRQVELEAHVQKVREIREQHQLQKAAQSSPKAKKAGSKAPAKQFPEALGVDELSHLLEQVEGSPIDGKVRKTGYRKYKSYRSALLQALTRYGVPIAAIEEALRKGDIEELSSLPGYGRRDMMGKPPEIVEFVIHPSLSLPVEKA